MQLKHSYIAKLLLLLFLSSTLQFPAHAQSQALRKSRYPKVLSVVEDSAGNFLLLNLQSSSPLTAPCIQYLFGPDGRTVMVADFQGLVFNQESHVFRPTENSIDTVRLGQFQANPPIFRISVTSSNPAALKQLEFSCQPRSLLIRLPGQKQAARVPAPAQIQTRPHSPSLASTPSPVIPATRAAANRISQPGMGFGNRAQSASASKSKIAPLTNPPFKQGGLYLSLADNQSSDESYSDKSDPRESKANSTGANSADLGGTKLYNNGTTVPKLAENRSDKLEVKQGKDKPEEKRSADEPSIRSYNSTVVESENSQNKSKGFGNRLKSLFHKTTESIEGDSELPAGSRRSQASQSAGTSQDGKRAPEPAANSEPKATAANTAAKATTANTDSKATPVKGSPEQNSGEKSITDFTNTPNPLVEFSGKDPLKVKFKFNSKVGYKDFKLEDPPRYVVDVDGLDFRFIASQEPEANPWLKSVRFGNPEENLARIVLDLNKADVHVESQTDASGQTLVLSLSNETAPLPETAQAGLRGRTIVLDAGHGGSDPGAQRGDIQEKEITLAITQKLKHYLEEHGMRVLMTRSDDTYVSLEDRVKISNETRPNAFVSIHINSLETDRDIKGIETYYHNEQSRALADKIHSNLVSGLKVPDRSVRKARFYVVNHSEHPSVLAEVGFISNKEERDKLISSDYQNKVAESVGQGVILFLTNAAEPSSPTVSNAAGTDWQANSRILPTLAKQGLSAVKQVSADTERSSHKRQLAQEQNKQN